MLGLAVARSAAGDSGRRRPADADGGPGYKVQPAADGSGNVVLLRNAKFGDCLVGDAGPGRRAGAAAGTRPETNAVAPVHRTRTQPRRNRRVHPQPPSPPARPSSSPGRPSFDCAKARTRGEIAVCSDSGSSALDRNMASQYGGAFAARRAPEQQEVLRGTAGASMPIATAARREVHRRRLCRPHARNPRHHGRALATALIFGG